jgi:anti-sigma B factor antagonist
MAAFTTVDRRPPTVVSVAADVDLNTAPRLLRELTQLVADGRRALVVDLTRVGFCDSSGLTALVRARNRLDEVGGRVTLAGATRSVARVLDISGLAEIFGRYPSVEAACAALAPPSADDALPDDGRGTGLVE